MYTFIFAKLCQFTRFSYLIECEMNFWMNRRLTLDRGQREYVDYQDKQSLTN